MNLISNERTNEPTHTRAHSSSMDQLERMGRAQLHTFDLIGAVRHICSRYVSDYVASFECQEAAKLRVEPASAQLHKK